MTNANMDEEPASGSRCRSCGAAIAWVMTSAGKKMPVNAAPRVAIVTDGGLVVTGRTSHFSTCPQAAAWRK